MPVGVENRPQWAPSTKPHAPSPSENEALPITFIRMPPGRFEVEGSHGYTTETADGKKWEVTVLPHSPIPKLHPVYDYPRVLFELSKRQDRKYLMRAGENLSFGRMPLHEENHFRAEAFFDIYFATLYPLLNPHHNGTAFPRTIGFREVGLSKSQVDHVGIWQDGIITVTEIAKYKKAGTKNAKKRNNFKNLQMKDHISGIQELFLPGEQAVLLPVIAKHDLNGKNSLQVVIGEPIILS